MSSVRAVASWVGIPGPNFSIVRDFFGYPSGIPRPLSLLKQVKLLKGQYINLNVIEVGENFGPFETEIDFAIDRMREIYSVSSVRLGIGRIMRSFISDEDAAEMGISSSILWDDDAEEITDKWNGPLSSGPDLFIVLMWGPDYSTLGRSETDGSCDKTYDAFAMTGSVVSILKTTMMRSGRTFAHELAHYLGLEHLSEVVYPVCDPGPGGDINSSTDDDEVGSVYNLMADPDLYKADPDIPKGPCNYTVDPEIAVDLTPAQGATMRSHCFVLPGYPF